MFKKLLAAAALALAALAPVKAQQPYAVCCFPDDVRDWTPQYDKSAKFNRSRVPLRQRINTPAVMKANADQSTEGALMVESVTAKMCGQCAAQGFDNFIGYNPTYWQYIDKFVNWGGADDEGIIVFPPAGVVDAAHTHGTKIFATIFFQATTNGKPWCRQIVSEEDGHFPYAKKLYEMAKWYGIDGFFINDESFTTNKSVWVRWVKDFYDYASADGDENVEIVWYDADHLPYIDMLNTNKRTNHFLDYGCSTNNVGLASQLNCTAGEVLHKVYSGQECARAGLKGFGGAINGAYPKGGPHVGSLALFCLEEHTWKDNVNKLFFTADARGEKAYEAMRKTFESERQTYVNDAGDPSKTGAAWRGFSGALVEMSTIGALPFISQFNVGNGKHRFAEGQQLQTRDWSHAGMQSYLPTYRWWIEGGDQLTESIDWDDAFSGGNSMKIAGSLAAGDHLMRLYKMAAAVPAAGGTVRLVYKSNNATVPTLRLATTASTDPDTEIAATSTTVQNGWTVAEYSLSAAAGKTIYLLGFNLKADAELADYTMRLGQLTVVPAGYQPAAMNITNLAVEKKLGPEGGDMRITWDWADNADLDHFDLYTVSASGTRTLVGQTRDEGFYVPEVKREGTEDDLTVELVPIMKDGSAAATVTTKAQYPKAEAPVVTIRTSCSYAKVGQTITLTATGTDAPTACHWTLPAGLTLAQGQSADKDSIKVVCQQVGRFSAEAQMTNTVGTGNATAFVVEVLKDALYDVMGNVALHKTIQSESSAANAKQGAANLIDGDRKPGNIDLKWCSTAKTPYAVIDLEEPQKIYGFGIFDCNSGNETYNNIANYDILVSDDAENWTAVVQRTGQGALDIKYDYIQPVVARYVKLAPWGDNNITTRVWEFEVYGRDASNLQVAVPAGLLLQAGETKTVTVGYELTDEQRAADFACTAKSTSADDVVIENIRDNAAGTITFDVKSVGEHFGSFPVTVRVQNGAAGSVRERTFDVMVDVPTASNRLAGVEASVKHMTKYNYTQYDYYFDYYSDKYTAPALTDGDTAADALSMIENPTKFADDLMIDFELPRAIDLGKVKLYFPSNNYAENDNGDMAEVCKDVSIRISEDGSNFTEIAKLSQLGQRSDTTFILPQAKKAKALRLKFNISTYSYPALAEVEAFAQKTEMPDVLTAQAVEIASGYNADVIAEAEPAADHTSTGLDGDGWVMFSKSYREDGATFGDEPAFTGAKSGYPYQLAGFDCNNGLRLDGRNAEGTLTFAEPVAAWEFYLVAITSDGAGNVEATVNYDNGDTSAAQQFSTTDWCGNRREPASYALWGSKRVNRGSGNFDESNKLTLTEHVIPANGKRKAVSVSFKNLSGARPTILAVSAGVDPNATGIEGTEAQPRTAVPAGIYNAAGMRIPALQRGLNIVRMADGTVKKVVVR